MSITRQGNQLILADHIGMEEAQLMRAAIDGILADHRTIVVDVGDVVLLDSSGLQALIYMVRRCRELGIPLHDVHVERITPRIQRLFEMTGTDRFFT